MKKYPLFSFFILSFAITWGLGGLYLLLPHRLAGAFGPMSTSNPIFIMAVWAPSISGFIVTLVTEGIHGAASLLKRFFPGRASPFWYMAVIFTVPVCGILINLVSGNDIGLFTIRFSPLLAFLFINLITGPLGEEFGWRGFALPRLLRRYSPLVASLILGTLWGLWHLPSFFVSGLPQGGIQFPLFLLGALVLSVAVTWIFIHTGGSIFFSFLLHYTVNFSLTIIAVPFLHLTLLNTGFVLAIVLFSGWDLGRSRIRDNNTGIHG
ncbi:MAG: CPBP family intramembrane metalloprotease [Spirochaetes bacterium]|nr:CPBP family intramembrane metalloprotease [Spirochaetota bacterium]